MEQQPRVELCFLLSTSLFRCLSRALCRDLFQRDKQRFFALFTDNNPIQEAARGSGDSALPALLDVVKMLGTSRNEDTDSSVCIFRNGLARGGGKGVIRGGDTQPG